jgi:hypothetical protein
LDFGRSQTPVGGTVLSYVMINGSVRDTQELEGRSQLNGESSWFENS